jgi:hypothetical protein
MEMSDPCAVMLVYLFFFFLYPYFGFFMFPLVSYLAYPNLLGKKALMLLLLLSFLRGVWAKDKNAHMVYEFKKTCCIVMAKF